MATHKEIEQVWKEFDNDFYRMAEEICDLREAKEKEIADLQAQIDEHVCENE